MKILDCIGSSRPVSFLEEWCRRRGVEFIDLFPAFMTYRAEKGCEWVLDEYYIEDDIYWNEEGHRLIADNYIRRYENDSGK